MNLILKRRRHSEQSIILLRKLILQDLSFSVMMVHFVYRLRQASITLIWNGVII